MDYELSYLIRMGAGKHPQCRDAYWFLDNRYQVISSCAVGAAIIALEALSGRGGIAVRHAVSAALHEARQRGVPVMTLNDEQHLTREAIADRLDALPGGSPVVRAP